MKMNSNSDCTILLVDNEQTIIDTLAEILELDDFKALKAESGNEAYKILEDNPEIDVVVTDVRMPDGNGLELLQKIKSNFGDKSPVICMISGQIDKDGLTSKETILGNGADVFWEKPIDPDHLIAYIKEKFEIP